LARTDIMQVRRRTEGRARGEAGAEAIDREGVGLVMKFRPPFFHVADALAPRW